MSKSIVLWDAKNGASLPAMLSTPAEIVSYAAVLSEKQQKQIVAAFQIEAYDMAAEYTWKKAITKLKETLDTLGPKFIGEMLGDSSIDEFSSLEEVLTDYSCINLAEQLGVIGKTAALKLKQSNELITHYFSKNSDEEIDNLTAMQIVKASVQYILSEQDISIALEFSAFRDRLLSEALQSSDPEVIQIIQSPLFYLKTVLAILLSALKNKQGAQLENAGANINIIVPQIWENISETDKWNVGSAYKDVTADGNNVAVSAIKSLLLKVQGFDYVPENLRSSTFKSTANEVIETHFALNNFYNEPKVIKKLINLGKSIPIPAFTECFQAYLVVYIGNQYGVSHSAAALAGEQLKNTAYDKWLYYFNKIISSDIIILDKLQSDKPLSRFVDLVNSIEDFDLEDLNGNVLPLFRAISKNKNSHVKKEAEKLLKKLK